MTLGRVYNKVRTEIISYHKLFKVSPDHLHSYLKVYLRDLAYLLLKLCTILGSL